MFPIFKKIAQLFKIALIRRKANLFDFRLDTRLFGRNEFMCSNSTELFRTIEFGGEADALGAFLFLLNSDDVVWDIGASVGLFSIHASKRVRQVYAFEPEPRIFERLNQNIAINTKKNVLAHQMALSDKPGKLALHSDGVDSFSPSLFNLSRHKNSIEVAVSTIDLMLAEGLKKPTVLKIDIEGAEALALSGASKVLSGPDKPRVIFMEVHPDFLPNKKADEQIILELLQKAGYKILSLNWRDAQYHIIALS